MNTKYYVLLALGVLLLLVSGGFLPAHNNGSTRETAPASAQASINLTDRANLERTTQIVIFRRTDDAAPMCVYLRTIVDSDLMHQFVVALDTDVKLTEPVQHPGAYELAFYLDDGSVQRFEYDCCLASPAFLHGEQAFFQGKRASAPDAFNALMAATLDSIAAPECTPVHQ